MRLRLPGAETLTDPDGTGQDGAAAAPRANEQQAPVYERSSA
jgi:hypothetical protein